MNIDKAEQVNHVFPSFESSDSSNEEIPNEYLKVFNKMKNKKIHYDEGEYFYSTSDINIYLKQRLDSRIKYFQKIKIENKLNFNSEADELYKKFLEFMYFEKYVNMLYFIKKGL